MQHLLVSRSTLPPAAALLQYYRRRLVVFSGVSWRGREGREMDIVEAAEAGPQQHPAAAASTSSSAVPFDRSSSRLSVPGAESFDGALRELKDLRSQMNEAADCCERAFRGTGKKKLILESTKSYICDAVVAVVDHLGTASSKLEHKMEEKTEISPMEQKLDFLKQRLLTCQQYAISLKLLTVRADPEAIQYHRRYISESTQRTKEENGAIYREEELLKPYECDDQIEPEKEQTTTTASVEEIPRAMRRSFSLRAEDVHIILGDQKQKKSSHGSNIMSFLKKTRRQALGSKALPDCVDQ